MVAHYHAQVVLESTSGNPEDFLVNNFYFRDNNGQIGQVGPNLSLIHASLQKVYTALDNAYWSDRNTASCYVKYYDLDLPRPNPPLTQMGLTWVPSTNSFALPGEVALCMSYFAASPSGTKPARRRGRVYFGPFSYTVPLSFARPPANLIEGVRLVGETLLNDSNASPTWDWCTFSPTDAGGYFLPGGSGPPNIVGAIHTVLGGWVDDSWDTQRRRGAPPSTRSTFGVTQARARINNELPEAGSGIDEPHIVL